MTYTQPVKLLLPRADWAPREKFSPSQLDTASDCLIKWAYRYILGIRPAGSPKSALLGTIIHACLQSHLKRKTVYGFADELEERTKEDLSALTEPEREKMLREAPRRALAGLHLLPNLDDPALEVFNIEGDMVLDTAAILPHHYGASLAQDPIVLEGRMDLVFKRAGVWYLVDHKSTAGRRRPFRDLPADPWAYVKDAAALEADVQANCYALAVMQKYGLTEIWIRWVYYLTDEDKHPDAKASDVLMTRVQVEERVRTLLKFAFDLRSHIRAARVHKPDLAQWKSPALLPPDPDAPCSKFGGCPYSPERGGPCTHATKNLGAMIASANGLPQPKPQKDTMETAQESPEATLPAIPGHTWVNPNGQWIPVRNETLQAQPTAAPAPAAPAVPLAPPTHAPVPLAPATVQTQGQVPMFTPPEAAHDVAPTAAAHESPTVQQHTHSAPAQASTTAAPAAEKKTRQRRKRPENTDAALAGAEPPEAADPQQERDFQRLTTLADAMKHNGILELTFHENGTLASLLMQGI